jgi:hypothetical protein
VKHPQGIRSRNIFNAPIAGVPTCRRRPLNAPLRFGGANLSPPFDRLYSGCDLAGVFAGFDADSDPFLQIGSGLAKRNV